MMAAGMLMPWPAVAEGEVEAPVVEEGGIMADTRTGPATPTDKIVDRFMALDADASRGVSFDEFNAMVEERTKQRYAAMDGNGDGEVSAEEYRSFWKAQKAQYYRLKR